MAFAVGDFILHFLRANVNAWNAVSYRSSWFKTEL